ncbi:MAG TPA: HlyD family efflux transporter periplasmic adaptor subunit, partial [Tepidisphaeraceae bacterium]|nr:HlyD family efflux transporter periplasmic adaptor subunit [Tepidisphaeraceae bacterium]
MSLQPRPTFSESWYRVQTLKPRLRPGAQTSRQFYRGERWYVVRDPAANQYHRLSDAAYRFVGLLDGNRTVSEAWELVGGQLADDAPTQPEVIQILSQLYAANLIETNIPPDATILLRRHKKQQLQKGKQRLMNVLFPRIPLWDPDWFLKLTISIWKSFLSPIGGIIWLIVVGTAIAVLLPHWDRLVQAGKDSLQFTSSFDKAILMYLAFAAIKFIHEMGHAATCRRFGGEVHEMGIMFLVLFPAPYVDASSAWTFQNKWHRILVGAGGMIFELFVAAFFAFLWIFTKDAGGFGAAFNMFCYNVMLIASVTTVIFNINPLLRYDGYYILSDFLEIPNLQFRSREYTLGLIKRHLFRVKWSQPLPTPSARPWMVFYFLTSGPYRVFVGFMILLLVLYQLPAEVQIIGILMGMASLATFIGMPIFSTTKYLLTEPELHRKRAPAIAWTLAFVALALGLTTFWRVPVTVTSQAVVLPTNLSNLFPAAIGYISEIRAQDGQELKQGDVILVARNEELESGVSQLEARLRGAQVRLSAAMASDVSQVGPIRDEIKAITEQYNTTKKQFDELTIRAPIDGKLVAPGIENMGGAWLEAGKPIAQVIDDRELTVFAAVRQNDHERIEASGKQYRTQVRFASDFMKVYDVPAAMTEV